MKAKDGLGRILAGRAPTADEGTAIDRVMQTPTPNRRQDDGMIELTARFRDGSRTSSCKSQKMLGRMGEIAYDEAQATKGPRFRFAKRRRNAVGGGSFFSVTLRLLIDRAI